MNTASSASNWADLHARSAKELFASVPAFAKCGTHPAIAALTVLSALAKTAIAAKRSDNSVAARVVISPKPDADPAVLRLIRHMGAAITGNACHARNTVPFDPGTLLERSGYLELLAKAIKAGANESELSDMAGMISKAIAKLSSQVSHLADTHLDRLLRRDLPQMDERPTGPSSTLEWLLAVDRSGEIERPNLLMRRWQALGIYAALSTVLREKPITLAIDEGRPLNPTLMGRLGTSAAELRALRGARTFSNALRAGVDLEHAVVELKAHSVPLTEWPGRGEPDQAQAWLQSPWAGVHRNTIIRVDYVGNQHSRDAIGALAEDILRPLAVHRAAIAKRGDLAYSFLQSFEFPAGLRNSEDRQTFLAVLNSAIIGPRGIKAFEEAVETWHRRVATISAVRHERRADRPGWPSICPPWHCETGVYEIEPITSAAGLVEEGNRLDHCVGGYYQQCRSGAVQILSLKRDGTHAATIELNLSGTTADPLSFRVGQFKAHRNKRPDDDLHDVLRAFVAALNSGTHPIFGTQLAAHRKRMEREGDYLWSARALPIAHAREVFPLYLPLLPRGTPTDLDTWAEQTGLTAALDRAVTLLSRSA
ncbi:PcfJ domain-containing protein [Aquibium sp. LZ166]|uniref:PcfJ domain-containing protein n=1 Tax=Aquibium pacificus TaxID=3153579 RepID=A0ABV3SPW5_9HYPH